MKKICWITGFNESYYNNVAKKSLQGWKKLSGDKILLVEMDPDNYQLPFNAIDIRNAHANFNSQKISDIVNRGGKFFKFFRKSLSVWYGLKNLKNNYDFIIWLDSDVIVDAEFNPSLFLPSDDQLYSTIFKENRLPDSGFAAFNTRHSEYDNFVNEYIDYYFNGKIYSLANPWDNYILEDYAKDKNIRNLWKGKTTTKHNATCGFTDTELEDYLTHFWGKKNKGKI